MLSLKIQYPWVVLSRKKRKISRDAEKHPAGQDKVKAVMFVPYTAHGKLAAKLREAEVKLQDLTGYKLKIVERSGSKMEDLLHQSDPWQGEDCCRPHCLLCITKQYTGKLLSQDCTRRSLIYETWCISCQERDEKQVDEIYGEDQKKNEEMKKKIQLYKYIGETSRSVYERAWEHQHDRDSLSQGSHLLKHLIDKHEGEMPDKVRFGIKVLKYTKTAFERQILESVMIQENRGHHILNSRSEYNRCALPRLTTKVGENHYKRWEKDLNEEKMRDELLESKIRQMRKDRNMGRMRNSRRETQPLKRRKIGSGGFVSGGERGSWVKEKTRGEKRQAEEPIIDTEGRNENDIRDIVAVQPMKKMRQIDIRNLMSMRTPSEGRSTIEATESDSSGLGRCLKGVESKNDALTKRFLGKNQAEKATFRKRFDNSLC